MEKSGFKVKKASTVGGTLRRIAIFVLVAAAAGTGIWYLLPKAEKALEKKVQELPPDIPAPLPAPEPTPVQEAESLPLSTASRETPVPAEDPETIVEKKPVTPAEKTVVTPAAEPPRKGIAHATDPADEEPYNAPDLVPAAEFTSRLTAIRTAGNTPEAMTKLQALLKETAFASPQFREAALLLNEYNRSQQSGSAKRTVYVVKPGDSLIRLARKFHLPTVRLAAENGLAADAMLKIGQKLQVPETAGSWSIRINKRSQIGRASCRERV